jgi:transketolase
MSASGLAAPLRPSELAGDADALDEVAARLRERVLDMCAGPEGGHLGSALSLVELLVALYFAVLRVDPARPEDPERDVLLLSKGHGALALYAALAERGFFPIEELASYASPGSRLVGHPVRGVPGVELPTGSLGHGLALGAGYALGARLAGSGRRTFVVLGDGELQEGSVWEAALCGASLGLDRLVAIVDRNGLQLTGPTEEVCGLEPLAAKWASFGWSIREVDGHDLPGLVAALGSAPWTARRPSVLVAHTRKGNGIPLVAGHVRSHYVVLSPRSRARFRASLRSAARRGSDDR